MVTIVKFDDENDEADRYTNDPARPETAIWEREWRFDVDETGSETSPEVIDEPGAFYVEVACERGAVESGEAGLYAAGQDGTALGGGQIVITLRDSEDETPISIGQETLD